MPLPRILCVSLWATAGTAVCAAEPLMFNRDIRPILSDNCFECHGPAKQKGGLRLDMLEVATQPVKSGSIAIVPGKPEASEALLRIFATDPDDQMPPADSGHKLSAAQKETLRRWVAEGATYQRHWAFEPIRQAPVSGNPDERWLRWRPIAVEVSIELKDWGRITRIIEVAG